MRPFGLQVYATLFVATIMSAGHAPSSVAGQSDNTLNAAFALEPEAPDTYKIAGREGLILARHIYDGLLYKDLDTGEIKPALAKAWRVIDPMTIEDRKSVV